MGRVYLIASAVLVISVCVLLISQYILWAVCAGGKPLVLVKNRRIAKAAIEALPAEQQERYGCLVFPKQNIEITPVWTVGRQFTRHLSSVDAVTNRLQRKLDFVAEGVAIVINGEEKLYVRDMKTGRRSLGSIKDKYRPRGAVDVEFEEKVELVEKRIPVEKLVSRDEAIKFLTGSSREIEIYQVKKGDTLWDIARKNGLDLATLLELNREIEPCFLQVGQEIKLAKQEPVLNVISRYEVVVMQDIPYPVIEKEDTNLDYGEIRVVQQGVPGQMEITYRILERNGKRVDKYPVKQLIKREPRPKIIATGSEMVLASRSGRSKFRPVKGRISSGFGMRYGYMHSGVDFAAPHGSPVVAMAAGTVEFAGYRGGYGLVIDIDHGNGMVTRYAHLSSVTVSAGEKVSGGELIGRVGATGNATGPHLHFEVRINGEVQDPEKFL